MTSETEPPRTFDSSHIELLFRTHARSIHLYAARRVGHHAAEDICATTFAEAWRTRDRFDPARGSARAWLFGIATNQIRHHKRAEVRQLRAYARTGVDPVMVDAGLVVAERVDAEVRWRSIAGVVASMKATDRDLVWLSAAELSYAEIAEATGVPIGTVRSRLARLRAKIAAKAGDDPLGAGGETEVTR